MAADPTHCDRLVTVLAAPVAILAVMANAGIGVSTGFMLVLTALAVVLWPEVWKWTAVAFVAGFASDLALNAYSGRQKLCHQNALRSWALQGYFTRVGALRAAVFAGFLSVWLVLPSVAIWTYLGWEQPLAVLPIGFMVGATTGVFSQSSRALAPLLPFYQATSGNLENRAWDGASVLVPLAVALALQRAGV